jgi:purine-binding chemotaxis protein CheW
VREIIPPRKPTRLPGAPASVLGIINVRGHIVTVADLGALLGMPAGAAHGSFILTEHGSRVVALAVEEVLDVQRVLLDALQPVPNAGLRVNGIQAVVEDGEQVIMLLDPDVLLRQLLLLQSEDR